MAWVHCYYALEDHHQVGALNDDVNLQTSTPIARHNNYDVSNNNNSLQFMSPPIANVECSNTCNSNASHDLSSEITHPNDNGSIASKTFSTPEHDQKFLP